MVEKLKHPFTINQILKLPKNKEALFNWLSDLRYSFNDEQILSLIGEDSNARQLRKIIKILELDLLDYKKLYWQLQEYHINCWLLRTRVAWRRFNE